MNLLAESENLNLPIEDSRLEKKAFLFSGKRNAFLLRYVSRQIFIIVVI